MSGFELNKTVKPDNPNALGILGYLIVLNNQVHSYEMVVLENYLKCLSLKIEDTCLDAIIKGCEETVSKDEANAAFSNESDAVKLSILYQMYVLSYVDNHFADSEEAYITNVLKSITVSDVDLTTIKEAAESEARRVRTENNTIFRRPPEKSSLWARIVAWFIGLFHRLLRKNNSVSGDTEQTYKQAIEKCSEIANEDLGIVEPAYDRVISTCQNTIGAVRKYKASLSLETGLSAGVAKTIGAFVDMLNKEVVEQTNRELLSLEQKKSTISDFTISLIGRTKAGKSTLHAILTQQGKDRIGIGKQRTTRYNWVYQWNLLRIIDTPGVGSAEADGRKDEEIAESVLGESDIICFVVADDSILKDVLEFIEKIALLNKPVIILLNHKENIRPDVKFRRFLAEPTQWMSEKGESSLKGHENRIRKYADDKGFGKLVNVYPVFLLPALMSDEDEYAEYRQVLWESSNVEFFIKEISSWILYSGQIKRSQTILDETISVFRYSKESIIRSEKIIDDQIDFLNTEKESRIQQLKESLDDAVNDIRFILEDRFDNLATNDALLFAEEYIDSESGDSEHIGEKWEAYVEKIEFEKNLKADIDIVIGTYREKVDRTINSLFEDLFYSVHMSSSFNTIDIPIQFDFRNVARFTSATLGLAGSIVLVALGASNPVGWVLSIAGAIGGLLTLLFSSKEKRRQEAIDKIYMSIKDEIKKETPDQVNRIVKQIYEELIRNLNSIETVYTSLISGLKWVGQQADNLIVSYSTEIDRMNKVYAWRIIQFLESSNEKLNYDKIDNEIENVDRSSRDKICIETRSPHSVNTEGLNTILAEDIFVKKGIQ